MVKINKYLLRERHLSLPYANVSELDTSDDSDDDFRPSFRRNKVNV